MRLREVLVFLALGAFLSPAAALTHYVDAGGSGDYIDIWGALSVASTGDTILVAPGLYNGAQNRNINPGGRNIVFLADEAGGAPVTIDCENESRAFRFDNEEDLSTLVRGFTIINGSDNSGGAIVVTGGASVRIEKCTFSGNWAEYNGGALYFFGSSSVIDSCVFRDNSVDYRGGAVYSYTGGNTFTGCLVAKNMIVYDSPPNQSGGAFYFNSTTDHIEYCTLAGNDVDQVLVYSDSEVVITNCLITDSPVGLPVALDTTEGVVVNRSACFGNAGGDSLDCYYTDVIFDDPLYCDDAQSDYRLCEDSFALPENNAWVEQLGALGAGCPPCGTPVEESTWGAVKALFRQY